MTIQPIDPNWTKNAFPAIFEVYGSALSRQIDAFNSVVGKQDPNFGDTARRCLLRSRHNRPNSSATKYCNELTPFHVCPQPKQQSLTEVTGAR